LAGSPGDYPESYSAGAFDANGVIASFSSRGASRLGGIKPNIAAPGVNVRSSVPGGGYANFHGTSMASPHVAGTVALMWSAAPAHIGSLVTTMTALDVTAHDVEDLQCGGTAADNNVWGEGMLDALAGVEMVQSAAPATVAGTVTDANTGVPLADVAIEVQGEGFELSASTATDGTYTFVGLAGDYTLSLSAFGYEPATATTTASGGQTTVLDVAMVLRPVHSVAGTVTLAGEPVAGTLVRLLDVPLPTATTDADGRYQIDGVPAGDYRLQMDARPPLGNCVEPNLADRTISVDADETVDFELAERTDAAGYGCEVVAPIDVEGTDNTGLVGDDKAVGVPLPFPFPFYGTSHERAFISTNGVLTFEAASEAFNNGPIPSTGTPNAAVYVLWDDHVVLDGSPVLTATVGTAPNRGFVIEWRDLRPFLATGRIDVEAVLYEDGSILMQYHEVAGGEHVDGGRATVGLENGDGTVGFQYSFNERMRFGPDFAVLFEPDRPPVVDLVTPGNGASYRLGDVVNADYVCADDRDPTPSCETS
jgi:hypothetical protein